MRLWLTINHCTKMTSTTELSPMLKVDDIKLKLVCYRAIEIEAPELLIGCGYFGEISTVMAIESTVEIRVE